MLPTSGKGEGQPALGTGGQPLPDACRVGRRFDPLGCLPGMPTWVLSHEPRLPCFSNLKGSPLHFGSNSLTVNPWKWQKPQPRCFTDPTDVFSSIPPLGYVARPSVSTSIREAGTAKPTFRKSLDRHHEQHLQVPAYLTNKGFSGKMTARCYGWHVVPSITPGRADKNPFPRVASAHPGILTGIIAQSPIRALGVLPVVEKRYSSHWRHPVVLNMAWNQDVSNRET